MAEPDSIEINAGYFSAWDYCVFGAMLLVSALIGIFYALRDWVRGDKPGLSGSSGTDDLLLGGRSLSVFPVAMSVLASFMSAISLLGTPAEVYQYGTMYWVVSLAFFMVIPATAYLYLPVFYDMGATSAYEYLGRRFVKQFRTMGTIIFTIHMLMYMPVVLYAPSLALAQVTGLSVTFSVLSIGIVCTFYTSFGGIKAVVWTDLFQTALMFASVLVITFKGATQENGWAEVFDRNVKGDRIHFLNFDTDPTVRHTVWSLLVGGYFTWMGNYAVNQTMVQRYLSLPTLKDAQKCIWITLPFMIGLNTITVLAGLVVYARYYTCNPASVQKLKSADQLFPLFVMDTQGHIPGLPGIFVAGIFSGALSTVSSGVNSMAAVTLEDIVKVYIKPNISDVWATRATKIVAVTYGLMAIALVAVAAKLGDVLQVALAIHGIVGGPMLGLYTLGMFFPWINAWGAGLGLLSGFSMAFWIGLGSFAKQRFVPKAPISVDGCLNLYKNITGLDSLPQPLTSDANSTAPEDHVFYGYRLSYMYYSAIGFIAVLVVGHLVTFLTGMNDMEEMDPKMISPPLRTLYSRLNIKLGTKFHNKRKRDPDDLSNGFEKEGIDNKNYIATTF